MRKLESDCWSRGPASIFDCPCSTSCQQTPPAASAEGCCSSDHTLGFRIYHLSVVNFTVCWPIISSALQVMAVSWDSLTLIAEQLPNWHTLAGSINFWSHTEIHWKLSHFTICISPSLNDVQWCPAPYFGNHYVREGIEAVIKSVPYENPYIVHFTRRKSCLIVITITEKYFT